MACSEAPWFFTQPARHSMLPPTAHAWWLKLKRLPAPRAGYSALSVALALPADGCVVGLDRDASVVDVARRYFEKAGISSKVRREEETGGAGRQGGGTLVPAREAGAGSLPCVAP